MIVNEGSLRSAESCSSAAAAAVSSAGASSPAAMSADLPASDGSPEGCGDSQPGDGTVLANGAIPCALNNNNNHMAVDFCKGGSRRKQSKPSRVSTADGGGSVGAAGTLIRELHSEGRDAAVRIGSSGMGDGDSIQYDVCRSIGTESPQPLSEAGDCTASSGVAAAVQLVIPVVTSSAAAAAAAAATSCDTDPAESGCDSVVNYPCHTCSRAFSTLLQREQHVHSEHASDGGVRGTSFAVAYHHVANNLMQPSASVFNAAAAAGLAKAKDVRSLLLPAMQYGLQLPTGQAMPAARSSPVTTVVGSMSSTSSTAVSTVASAASGPGLSSSVFHPEAYCDICQREFCNKYFLKTHRANIHGIYASDAVVPAPNKDRDVAATPLPVGNCTASSSSSTSIPHAEGKRDHVSHSRDGSGAASAAGGGLAGFSCDICRKPFSSGLYVKKHLLNVHGIGQQSPSLASGTETIPMNLAAAAAAAAAMPATVADRRNAAWDVLSWSSAAAAMIANREFGALRRSEPATTELLDRAEDAAAAATGSTGSDYGGSRNSSSASSPSGALCYGQQPQRSPLCLTMNSSGMQSTSGGSGVYGGSASDGFGSRTGSSIAGGAISGSGVGINTSPNASGGGHVAAMALAGKRRDSGDAPAAIEGAEANSDDATNGEAVDARANVSGTPRPPSAGDRASDVLAKCKEAELQRMFGAAAGYMDWDDGELLRHGSIESSRRSAGTTGIGCSPPRKRKALESIFGYGTNGFFDAAMAVRMADRIACDICGKEVCNKYFLKAHKLKMHGVMDSAQSKRQQQHLLMQLLPAAGDNRSDGGDPAASGDSNSLSSGGRGTTAVGGSSEFDTPAAAIGADRSPSSSSSLTVTPQASDMRLDATMNASNRDSASDGLLIKMEAPDDGPSIDGLLAMGIDPEAYCSICKKEFCSKYFLRTHKLNMHGIVADGKAVKQSPRSMQTGVGAEAAVAGTVAAPPLPGSPESGSAGTGMVVGEVYKQWRWKEPANQTRVFCDICNKELCNKYFLRTHKLNKHGIVTAPDGGQTATSGSFGIGGSPASGRQQQQQQQQQRAGGAGSPATILQLTAPSTGASPSPVFQQLPRGADLFGTAADGQFAADRQALSSACSSVAAASTNTVAVGTSSAIVASSRILGLKFDLDQQQQPPASEPVSAADVGLQRQRSLGSRSGGSPSVTSDLLLPPPSAGMPDAWSLLQIAATAGRLSSVGTSASDGANGGTRSAAAASAATCCTCGMPFDSIEELARHGLQAGHPVVIGSLLDLQQNVPYGALQRELSMLPDASAAQLRRMSMAFLMGGSSSSHGRAHSNKSASVAGGEKLYSCSRCDYKTPWLSNIYSHEQRKHGGGAGSSGTRGRGSGEVHTCGVCLRTFSYEHSLMRHVTEYHGGVGLPQTQLQQSHATAAQTAGTAAINVTLQPPSSGSGPSEAATEHEGDGAVTSASEHSASSSSAVAIATTATTVDGQMEQPPASHGSRTTGSMVAHSTTVAVAQKRRSRCPYCSKQFINKYLCQSHIRHVHGVCTAAATAAPSDHAAMYACSMCKFTCRVLSNLRMHQAIKHKLPLPPHDVAWDATSGLGCAGAEGESAVESGDPQQLQQKWKDVHIQHQLRRSHDGEVDAEPTRTDDDGRPVVMQPFRIVGVSGADHFAPATVYLPVYRPVAGESLVTFTLRSVEN